MTDWTREWTTFRASAASQFSVSTLCLLPWCIFNFSCATDAGLCCVGEFGSADDYQTSLQINTVVPLVLVLMLWLPSLRLILRGDRESARFKGVSDAFYWALMLW